MSRRKDCKNSSGGDFYTLCEGVEGAEAAGLQVEAERAGEGEPVSLVERPRGCSSPEPRETNRKS